MRILHYLWKTLALCLLVSSCSSSSHSVSERVSRPSGYTITYGPKGVMKTSELSEESAQTEEVHGDVESFHLSQKQDESSTGEVRGLTVHISDMETFFHDVEVNTVHEDPQQGITEHVDDEEDSDEDYLYWRSGVSFFFSLLSLACTIASYMLPLTGFLGGVGAAYMAGFALVALIIAYFFLRYDRKHAPVQSTFMQASMAVFFLAAVACGLAIVRLLSAL